MTKEIELTDSERQPCECWTRVMGYFRPVSEFNQGKKAEFKERKYFSEAKIPQSIQGIAQYHKKIKNYLRRHNIAGDFLGISIGLERKNYKFVLVGKNPKNNIYGDGHTEEECLKDIYLSLKKKYRRIFNPRQTDIEETLRRKK